ncbi:CocE/NonD family hydrolase [Pseudanabaenaceae cyanobacterium LEGE 13415]|nr:CocE/NonD family hydrolase [Pseudanabaenaceae cyanobacterium LEGE 13415]
MVKVIPKQTVSMYTRDRIRLDADVYYPGAEGTFPVLLMRQPYGRSIASTVVYAHPIWYASHGYIVVIQDVRGRGTSEGEFKLFENEISDGVETVHWAANLPRSNGKVGMYGFSYQGMTQLYAALDRPEPLKAICPAMLAPDLYKDWAYENGAFCLFANLGWAIQLAAETARLKGDETAFLELSRAAKNVPLSDRIPARPEILQKYAHYDAYYQDWLDCSDAYWQKLSIDVSSIDIPMLYIGGWFDTYMRGTLRSYFSSQQAHLIVGAWAHLPWGRKVGAVDYGADAASFCDRAQVRWFDHWLKDQELILPPVQLFEMGSNQWRFYSEFPKADQTILHLNSTGLASMDEQDGGLRSHRFENAFENHQIDVIVHDPWRPVPALGGHLAYPCGSFERSHIDARSDVLTYTTAPLEADLHLVGEMIVELCASSDSPSFDLCAVLSEVKPSGSVMNFSQGYLSSNNSELQAYRIPLQPICICIPKGSAIRLSVSGACFPAYPVNAGTGAKPGEASAIDFQLITIMIHTEGSKVLLNMNSIENFASL